MSNQCSFCNSPIDEDAKFCSVCGKAQPAADAELPGQQPDTADAAQPAETYVRELTIPEGQNEIAISLSPQGEIAAADAVKSLPGALLGGAGSLCGGFVRLFRNPKAAILTAVLAVLWFVLGHLIVKGKTGTVTDALSWLTYARGGLTGGASGLLGGVLGKGLVGAGFGTLLFGGGPRCFSGIGHLLKTKSMNPGSLLTGFGLAGLAYAFMAGTAGLSGTMVGISGAALALRAVTVKNGFFSSLAASLSAQKGAEGVRTVVPARFRGILAGAAAGFAVSALLCGVFSLSMTGWFWYGVLLAAVIAGVALILNGRKNVTRMLSFFAAVSLVVCHALMIFTLPVRAEETGYWKYVKYWTDEDLLEDPIYDGRTAEGDAASGFHVHNQLIEHNIRGPYGDSPGQKGHQDCYGEYGDMFVTFSPLPNSKERYEVGESLSINVNLEADTSDHRLNPGGYVNIYLTWDPRSNPFSTFKEAGNGNDRIQPALDQSDGYNSLTEDFSGVFTQEIPAGNTGSHSHLYFCFHLVVQNGFINSFYEYEWVDTTQTEPIAALTETTTTTATTEPATTAATTTTTTVIQIESRDAEKKGGIDYGIGINSLIITGITGAALGAAMIGAAGSKNSGGDDKKPRYRMHINKFDGNTLCKGPSTKQWVNAFVQDQYLWRLDRQLSQKIRIYSEDENVKIKELTIRADGPHARLEVPYSSQASSCTVCFSLSGPGGLFIEKLRFFIAGDPFIRIKQSLKDDWTQDKCTIPFLISDAEQSAFFELCDFGSEPDTIEITGGKYISGSYERYRAADIPEDSLVYRLKATVTMRKPDQPFGDFPVRETLHITAIRKQNPPMRAEGTIQAEIWPEGLSAASPNVKNGALTVLTEQTAEKAIPRTLFTLTLACFDTSVNPPRVKVQPAGKTTAHFGRLQNTEAHGHLLTDNFRYEIELPENGESDCAIQPKNTLPVPKEPYDAMLPVSVEFEGQTYELELPLRLAGDTPAVPMDWQTEVDKLKKTVAEFGLSQKPWEREFFRNIRHRTPNEISMARYAIIMEACDYYEKESLDMAALGNRLERIEMTLNVVKWIGDQAFSYLATVYMGGPIGEAVLSPLKDLFAQLFGTYAGAMLTGDRFDFEGSNYWKTVLQVAQKCIEAVLTGENPPTPKNLGYVVASYITISYIQHYYTGEEERGDIYKSLIAAFGDLGGTYLKSYVGKCFQDYLKSSQGFGQKLGKWLKTYYFNDLFQRSSYSGDGLQLLSAKTAAKFIPANQMQKFVEEFSCLIGTKVYECIMDTTLPEQDVRFKENSWVIIDNVMGCTIEINLLDNIRFLAEEFYKWALEVFDRDAQQRKLSMEDYLARKGYSSDGTRGGEALDPHGMDSTRPTMDIGTDVHGGGYMR